MRDPGLKKKQKLKDIIFPSKLTKSNTIEEKKVFSQVTEIWN